MKKLLLFLGLLFTVSTGYCWITIIGAPQDQTFTTAYVATVRTTNPYNVNVSTGTAVTMNDFTGVFIRAKYTSGQTITTHPVIAVWGRKGDDWINLRDANGSRTVTLSDASTDVTNGSFCWTDVSEKIDALGCYEVKVTVITRAVVSGGICNIEISRY